MRSLAQLTVLGLTLVWSVLSWAQVNQTVQIQPETDHAP
jgi:hypothetical protein